MIEAALYCIPSDDRDTWVRCAMAIKSELGEGGFELWDAWSQQSESYKPRDAKAVWRSVKPHGGITIGTLYAEAKANGYRGEEIQPRPRVISVKDDEDLQRWSKAAQRASEMLNRAILSQHDYLARKGFPEHQGFVLKGVLLIPMRDMRTNKINSLQTITAAGEKKFLTGGRAKGSVFCMGSGAETFLCEGYATALSIQAALKRLYRRATVVVCFSASNMAHVAQSMGQFVVADHDTSGTGEKYARKAGLPWWMPPTPGDANDFHVERGVGALAREINELKRKRAS